MGICESPSSLEARTGYQLLKPNELFIMPKQHPMIANPSESIYRQSKLWKLTGRYRYPGK